jgi:hypothetical protein
VWRCSDVFGLSFSLLLRSTLADRIASVTPKFKISQACEGGECGKFYKCEDRSCELRVQPSKDQATVTVPRSMPGKRMTAEYITVPEVETLGTLCFQSEVKFESHEFAPA